MPENNCRETECQNSAGEEKNDPDALVPPMAAGGAASNHHVAICDVLIRFRKFRQLQPALAVSFLGLPTRHIRYCEPALRVTTGACLFFRVQITGSNGPMLAEKSEDRNYFGRSPCIHAGSRVVQEPAQNPYYASLRIAEGEEP